jgi:regulator-associated protein of mTOR
MHPFRIWDWQGQRRLNQFSNGNPAGSKINEVRYINEDDQALLMTGSSDGVIKLFRHYESNRDIEVVTAFRALPELIPSNRNAGLVLDWQQGQGKALVAGDVKVIRVWNAATEVCTNVSLSSQVYSPSHHSQIWIYRTFLHALALA